MPIDQSTVIDELTRVYRQYAEEIKSVRVDPIALKYLLQIDTLLPLNLSEVQTQATLLEAHVWECLHLTHWQDVEPQYRKIYGLITWTLAMCYAATMSMPVARIHQLIDKGILLGSPDTIDILLSCHSQLQKASTLLVSDESSSSSSSSSSTLLTPLIAACAQSTSSCKFRDTIPKTIGWSKHSVPTLLEPDLMSFYTKYFLTNQPVVLRGCLDNWKALSRWSDLEYIDRVAGHRLVPVEVGRDYLSNDSGQTLMTIRDFICQYILDATASASSSPSKRKRVLTESEVPSTDGGSDCDAPGISEESNSSPKIGYIAQHCLFDQIPDLRRDISVPDYCSFLQPSEEEEEEKAEAEGGASLRDVLVNAWFGPVSE